MKIRIGTRGSQLALAQAGMVGRSFRAHGHDVALIVIRTAGDVDRSRAFVEVGAPGVFVREIEQALVDERVDVAVHSFKDLPSLSPERLVVAAVAERLDPADHLLVRPAAEAPDRGLLPLRDGALVGTASARRRALLRHHRPDLRVDLLRGNLPTRVRRVVDGDFDATLLAGAGLARLDREAAAGAEAAAPRTGLVEVRLDPERFIPAPSQGAVAVQVRRDDDPVRELAAAMDDRPAHRAVRAERALLARVQGGCDVPFGAWCRALEDGRLHMTTFLERGGVLAFADHVGDDPEELAGLLWDRLRAACGGVA